MTAVWLTIALVAVAGAAIKATGPLLLGDRPLGPRATRIITLLAPALLTALVLVGTVTTAQRLVIDARLAGITAAGVALLFRAPMLVAVLAAALTTALVRLLAA